MFDQNSSHVLQERTLNLTVALYRVTDYFPKAEILRGHLRAKANEIFERLTEYDNSVGQENEIEPLIQKIKTMKGYLCLASTLNYVRSLNFTILEKEYSLIEQFLEGKRTEALKKPIHEDIQHLERSRFAHTTITKITGSTTDSYKNGEYASSRQIRAGAIEETKNNETDTAGPLFYERKNEVLNERQKVIMDRIRKSGQARISDFYASFAGVSSKTIQRDLQNLINKEMLKKEGEKRWTVYSLAGRAG